MPEGCGGKYREQFVEEGRSKTYETDLAKMADVLIKMQGGTDIAAKDDPLSKLLEGLDEQAGIK